MTKKGWKKQKDANQNQKVNPKESDMKTQRQTEPMT